MATLTFISNVTEGDYRFGIMLADDSVYWCVTSADDMWQHETGVVLWLYKQAAMNQFCKQASLEPPTPATPPSSYRLDLPLDDNNKEMFARFLRAATDYDGEQPYKHFARCICFCVAPWLQLSWPDSVLITTDAESALAAIDALSGDEIGDRLLLKPAIKALAKLGFSPADLIDTSSSSEGSLKLLTTQLFFERFRSKFSGINYTRAVADWLEESRAVVAAHIGTTYDDTSAAGARTA